MREENRYRIAELILKFLETKASLEEIVELQEWISLSEENRNNFQKLRNIWEMTNPSASQMNINIGATQNKNQSRNRTAKKDCFHISKSSILFSTNSRYFISTYSDSLVHHNDERQR